MERSNQIHHVILDIQMAMDKQFHFLLILYLASAGQAVALNATITKFHSSHIALHCIMSLPYTRSSMECAILFMREQVYNYAFVYRDGCHVCRSPLGKTNDANQDEYMFRGPHYVKGMTIMYFFRKCFEMFLF